MSCMIIFFYKQVQISRSDIRPHKVGCQPGDFAYGHFNIPPGFVWTFSVMYDHTFSKLANHQIKHQTTHKVGCQPGDCMWSL